MGSMRIQAPGRQAAAANSPPLLPTSINVDNVEDPPTANNEVDVNDETDKSDAKESTVGQDVTTIVTLAGGGW